MIAVRLYAVNTTSSSQMNKNLRNTKALSKSHRTSREVGHSTARSSSEMLLLSALSHAGSLRTGKLRNVRCSLRTSLTSLDIGKLLICLKLVATIWDVDALSIKLVRFVVVVHGRTQHWSEMTDSYRTPSTTKNRLTCTQLTMDTGSLTLLTSDWLVTLYYTIQFVKQFLPGL